MALPALMAQDLMAQEARIAILAQTPDPDGRGLSVAFTAQTPGEAPQPHLAACRFRMAGRPARIPRSDLADPRRRAPIGSAALSSHPLLAGDAGGPGRRSRAHRRRQRAARRAAWPRLWIANGAGRAAAGVDLRAAGGGLFAHLRPDRTHQFRLRRNRCRGRLRGGDRGARHGRLAARSLAGRRPSCWRPRSLPPGASLRRTRCSFRCARLGVSRCWWRAWAWRFSCASCCAWRRATGRAG